MPKSWSMAVKACREHPSGVVRPTGERRACSCRVGWRYRMGRPDLVTGKLGRPEWSQTFPTKEAADADQRAVRLAIAEGRYASDGGRDVGVWLREWLDRKADTEGRKASTVEGYRRVVEGRLIPEIGSVRLGRLTRPQVQALLDRIGASDQKGRGKGHLTVSAGTVRGVHRVLRSALADAKKAGLVPYNVAEDVSLPPVPKHVPVALGLDRVRTWLEWVDAQDDRLAALWHCCAVYGPRRGELLGLRWSDVDTARHLVLVQQTVLDVTGDHPCERCGGVHHNVLFDTPKSAAGERLWPLVPAVEASLQIHRLRQDGEREAYGSTYADHDLIFCGPDGNPLLPDCVSDGFGRAFVKSGASVGLKRVPPLKSLRSTMVTLLHEQGVPLETIARLAGHSGTRVTDKHYLSISAEAVRGEFADIASALRPGGSDRHSDHRVESARSRPGPGGDSDMT